MLDRFKAFWQGKALAPFINLFIRLGISPDAVTLVGTLGVCGRRAGLLPAGLALAGRAGDHGVRLQRPDRRRDGAQDRPHRHRSAPSSTPPSTGSPTPRCSAAWRCSSPGRPTTGSTSSSPWSAWSMGSVTSYARSKGEQLGLQRQDRARRAPRPAGRVWLMPTFFGDLLDLPMPLTRLSAAGAARGAEHDHGRPADPARTPPGARSASRYRIGRNGPVSRRLGAWLSSTPTGTTQRGTRHRHHPREARHGRDAQGRRDHGRRHRRAGEDRRGRRRGRRDGARAGAGRHPRPGRRVPDERPRHDRRDHRGRSRSR